MDSEYLEMHFPEFNRETFWALWFAPMLCLAVSAFLFWWGLS